MNKISAKDLGYIAGMIDGEGTLTISKHRQYNRKKETYQYRPFIWITNTNEEVLQIIQKKVGLGTITSYQPSNKKYKKVFYWRILKRSECLEFLRLITKTLIIKWNQALIMMEFLESREDKTNDPYTKQEITLQSMIKKINKR